MSDVGGDRSTPASAGAETPAPSQGAEAPAPSAGPEAPASSARPEAPGAPTGWRGLSPRALPLWRLTGLVGDGVLTAVVAVAVGALVGPRAALVVLGVSVVAAALAWRVAGRRHAAWAYAEREADLLVRRGVLVRRLSVVPYGRMQFVDVTSGPVERRFGLATVSLHTAAAATDARIPGLDSAEATRLRDRLAVLGEARAAGL